jgi:hypothetical protein
MTALLADPMLALYVLPARVQMPAQGTNLRPPVAPGPRLVVVAESVEWDAPGVDAAVVGSPRYEWTARGLAVMLALVGLVVGVMATTLVTAFLAVSNEPLPAAGSPVAVVDAAAAR